jgi:diguanylate cyclase (GGDEF)-like protein/PAS domain S-box-containing protein
MPRRSAHVLFGAWMLALTAAFYLFPQLSMFTWAAIGLSGAAAVLLGIRLHRPSRRLPWWLLSGVLVSFTAGDTTYNICTDYLGMANPFPGPGDVFYLAVYPMLAAALIIFIRARSGGGGNRAALLDALLPTAGMGLLSWVFLMAPYVHDPGLSLLEKLTSIAYPLGDVLALAILLRLVALPGRRPAAITVIGAGVTGLLVTDLLYLLRQLAGTWEVGGPTDAGWVFFYTAIGVAALHPSMTQLTPTGVVPAAPVPAGGRRIVFMSIAALIAPAVLFVENLRGAVQDAAVIAGVGAVMFLLVMARVSGLFSTQRLAAAREQALREAGAMLVAAATEQAAGEALRRAVVALMPAGTPYRLVFQADVIPAGAPATAVSASAVMVPVADLPPNAAGQLADFEFALQATGLIPGRTAAAGARRSVALLGADSAALNEVRPSFDALMSQGSMAIGRISATSEVDQRSSEDYFRTLIQSASDVILIVDDDERIRYASPSADTVFGRTDLAGTEFSALIDEADHDALREVLSGSRLGNGRPDSVVVTAIRADGRSLQVECGCRDLRADPTVAGLVLTIRDVTERLQLENDLTHQAFHDGLTGLANRVQFRNRLEHAALVAQLNGTTIGVLFVDIDDFKDVNDTLGHAVGDQLLIAVGQRIADTIGSLNTAARMGGDEFAVLIENSEGSAEAEEVAARIVAALMTPVEVGDGSGGTHVISGAASVGVATSQEAFGTTELQRQADLALYVAKGAGKNNWQRYQSDLHAAVVERLELRTALNDAADGDQLVLRFQPIVDLPTEGIVGVEALVRWQHPVRGLLGPDQFIELAEENGSIVAIGGWVLRESLRTFVEWRGGPLGGSLSYISVNVSARQFRTAGFVAEVRDALADTGARPEWLVLEITESLVLRDAESVWADLRELRALGIRIAIDDFGTGYSSLSYLRQMPVDVLKIDKSFIDDILPSDEQQALVRAIVSLAQTLKLAVIAEGIEDAAQRLLLLQMGCPYGQGFHFAKPLPADEIAQRYAPHSLVS